ncbi:DUF4169 family protein [Tabrizicola sp.]|uniref:DUF4169 family protein n=1 Tax=Tabrizicola sp. TaxID=2005166 RepID=UPI0027336379|nr:DUF4169 family protein [Tabrizicola sp.]MDP3194670.1 DUF4169 family protein [Tabrizicola sp.]
MAEVVNLRMVKKQVARKAARSAADANAAKHGRTKAERDLEKARAEKTARALDGHKRETE